MELPRLTRWLRRYGPAEVTGIGTALLGSYAVHALTGNEIAADGWVVAQLGTGQVVGEYGMFGPPHGNCRVERREQGAGARSPALSSLLLAFPESAMALFRLTVERLIAQRGERRPKRPSL